MIRKPESQLLAAPYFRCLQFFFAPPSPLPSVPLHTFFPACLAVGGERAGRVTQQAPRRRSGLSTPWSPLWWPLSGLTAELSVFCGGSEICFASLRWRALCPCSGTAALGRRSAPRTVRARESRVQLAAAQAEAQLLSVGPDCRLGTGKFPQEKPSHPVSARTGGPVRRHRALP